MAFCLDLALPTDHSLLWTYWVASFALWKSFCVIHGLSVLRRQLLPRARLRHLSAWLACLEAKSCFQGCRFWWWLSCHQICNWIRNFCLTIHIKACLVAATVWRQLSAWLFVIYVECIRMTCTGMCLALALPTCLSVSSGATQLLGATKVLGRGWVILRLSWCDKFGFDLSHELRSCLLHVPWRTH